MLGSRLHPRAGSFRAIAPPAYLAFAFADSGIVAVLASYPGSPCTTIAAYGGFR